MPARIKKQGEYELYRTPKDEEILKLEGDWYAVVKTRRGDHLVASPPGRMRKRTVQKGRFKLVDFQRDKRFVDMPHLFLQHDGVYQEAILPKGLPGSKGHKERFLRLDRTIGVDELESYLKSPQTARGLTEPVKKALKVVTRVSRQVVGAVSNVTGELMERYKRPPIPNYETKNAPEVIEAMNDLSRRGIKKVRRFEEEFAGRKTILEKAEIMLERKRPPIDEYYETNAKELAAKLDILDEEQLTKLRDYELDHKNRKVVIEAITRELQKRTLNGAETRSSMR